LTGVQLENLMLFTWRNSVSPSGTPYINQVVNGQFTISPTYYTSYKLMGFSFISSPRKMIDQLTMERQTSSKAPNPMLRAYSDFAGIQGCASENI
jgi:hypothetical protein